MDFETIKNFIVNNWDFISLLLVCLLELLIIIFKKSKKQIIDRSYTVELLRLIVEAEKTFGSGHGVEKKEYVMKQFFAQHPDYTKDFSSIIGEQIEVLLSSPQKKGVR
jgi:hypothetical protein